MQNPAAHASGFIEHDDHCHRAVRSLRVECYREQALLFRTLATLRADVPVFNTVDDFRRHAALGGI